MKTLVRDYDPTWALLRELACSKLQILGRMARCKLGKYVYKQTAVMLECEVT